MIRKLQKKFILIAMTCLLCVTAVLIATINTVNFIRLNQRSEDLLTMISSKDPFGSLRPEAPRPEMPGEEPFHDRHSFGEKGFGPETEYTTRWFSVTLSSGGQVLFLSVDKIAAVSSAQAEAYGQEVYEKGRSEGYKGIYRYRSVEENDTVTVYFLDCQEEMQSAFFLLVTTVCIGLIFLLLLFLLISLFSRRALRPVIENAERQKRFITDAGHELKTPLSIISANTDVLSVTGEENEWVRSIRHQTDRMEKLVEDLLTLARGEESLPAARITEFDLSKAVTDTVESFLPMAEMQGNPLSLRIQPGVICSGDESALRRLISILMENALKYASAGGEISFLLRRENKSILLEQTNPCDKVPDKGALKRLFDRFYRDDPSRSRETGGYGIGLSIARSIVESHKGKISASADGDRICFTVVI